MARALALSGMLLAYGLSAPPTLIPYAPDPTDDNTPRLVWRLDTGATAYTVELSENADFSSTLYRRKVASDTFHVVEAPLAPGKKYWRVSSHPDSNAWSSVDDFTVTTSPDIIAYQPDSTPTRRPVFQWRPVVGATSYKIQINDSIVFTTPILATATVPDLKYQPNGNLPHGPIYWRVASNYDTNYFSLPNRIFVDTNLVPELIPQQPDPTTENRPTLAWKAVPRADAYWVQIDDSSDFDQPLFTVKVTGKLEYRTDSLPQRRIHWRVSSSLDSNIFSRPDDFLISDVTAVKPALRAGRALRGRGESRDAAGRVLPTHKRRNPSVEFQAAPATSPR